MDITEVILNQHDQQRRAFAALQEFPREDTEGLSALWSQLRIFLERHAEAEELYFYPELVKIATGAGDAEDGDDEVEDAIKDHNELRDAIAAAEKAKVGSDDWWTAVTNADVINSDHMAEEERQDLADFRQQASLELRHTIAVAFLKHLAAAWCEPIGKRHPDPNEFIAKAEKAPKSAAAKAAEKLAENPEAADLGGTPPPSHTGDVEP